MNSPAKLSWECLGFSVAICKPSNATKRTETLTEFYWRLQLNPYLALSLDLQFILYPTNNQSRDKIWVEGLKRMYPNLQNQLNYKNKLQQTIIKERKMQTSTFCRLAFLSVLLITVSTNVNAEIFEGYPDIIVCEAGKGEQSPGDLVYYIESRDKKGTLFYRTTHRRFSIKVSKDGYVRADTGSFNTCLNKSLDELRKKGSTFKFTKH